MGVLRVGGRGLVKDEIVVLCAGPNETCSTGNESRRWFAKGRRKINEDAQKRASDVSQMGNSATCPHSTRNQRRVQEAFWLLPL